MRTVVLTAPGRFDFEDRPRPVPAPGEALVRVRRIGVCGTDLHAFAGRQPFFHYPRVLGHELAVEVVDPGGRADLTPGDWCAVEPYLNCGACIACRRGRTNCCTSLRTLGVHVDGGMRPWLAVPARLLHPAPGLSPDQLALVETLGIGAHAVERAELQTGDFVLVLGAGPIGLSVIQFARAAGARVAVFDPSAPRREFCRHQLGVELVADPTEGDAASWLLETGGGDAPTAVFDATGNAGSMQRAFSLPAHGGRLVFVGLVQGKIEFDDPDFHRRELTLLASRNATAATFRTVIAAVQSGAVDTRPWITHRLSFAEVPERFTAVRADPALLKAMIEVGEGDNDA